MSLILVGFMGAGKTTIGQQISPLIHLPQQDLDDLIIKKAGKPIPQIFDEVGEAGFRQLETQVLESTIDDAAVISTGGGVIMQTINRHLLQGALAPVVYLKTSFETILARIQNDDNRPLATNITAMARLFNQRQSLYEEVADIVVDTDEKSPAFISTEIMNQLASVSELRHSAM